MKVTRNKTILLVITLLLVLFVLVVINSLTKKESAEIQGINDQKGVVTTATNEVINYNFSLPRTGVEKGVTKSLVKDISVNSKIKNTLKIQKLNLETKIIRGTDGEAAINEGAWLYPSSYEMDGEKILLGHRRYWGADDPRSFWNLNQLKKGDEVLYYDSEGRELKYKVIAVGLRTGDDHSILKPSKENLIKVISCSTPDGSAGSSEKRIVVIAELV